MRRLPEAQLRSLQGQIAKAVGHPVIDAAADAATYELRRALGDAWYAIAVVLGDAT